MLQNPLRCSRDSEGIYLSLIVKLLLACAHTHAHTHLGGKRQLERVSSLLPPWGPGDQAQLLGLVASALIIIDWLLLSRIYRWNQDTRSCPCFLLSRFQVQSLLYGGPRLSFGSFQPES